MYKTKEREAMRSVRKNPVYKAREREAKQYVRKDPVHKTKEREAMRSARENQAFKAQEKVYQNAFKRKARENPYILECERIKKQQIRQEKRKFNDNVEINVPRKRCKHDTDTLPKTCHKDFVSIEESIKQFHSDISIGPLYVCTCCHQTWFRKSVSMLKNTHILAEREAMDENFTVAIQLKKKLSYKKVDFKENVRPLRVLFALHWLMNNSELYKKSGIVVDNNWFQEVTESVEDTVREFLEVSKEQCKDKNNTEEEKLKQDDTNENDIEASNDYDSDHYSEIDANDHVGNIDTLVDDADIDNKYDKVFTFAPGEGQHPLSLYQDKDTYAFKPYFVARHHLAGMKD